MTDKYFIEAEATWEIGAAGDALEPFIVARVKDINGEPVTGLKKSDFIVYNMGFGFGNTVIAVVQEIAAEAPSLPVMPGTYRLKLRISHMMTGQFVFALIIKNRVRRKGVKSHSIAQTLVSAVKLK